MKKTLAIIKSRWQEVALILFFSCAAILLMLEHEKNVNAGAGFSFMMAMVVGGFMVLGYIFQIGFLRTIVFEPDRPFQPKELLMIGRLFLWRIVGFSVILGLAIFVLANSIVALMAFTIGGVEPGGDLAKQIENLPDWYPAIAMGVALLLTVRYWVFVPAVILVKDCRLLETFKLLKPLKFFKAGEVLLWLFLIFVFNGLAILADLYIKVNGNMETVITAVAMLASAFLAFGMQIAAVKHVKSIGSIK